MQLHGHTDSFSRYSVSEFIVGPYMQLAITFTATVLVPF